MKEIKFTTNYHERVLSFNDENFKDKYEARIGGNPNYIQSIDGEIKYLALCPKCNNPVAILGVFKYIDVTPHARHIRNVKIENVTEYDEYKYLRCPYHVKKANYIKEYVPETEEPQRQELYKIAKEHYDKAIYLLQKETGIYITLKMAEELAENYAIMRAYNYIDATIYNIPWYLIYSYTGFQLKNMIVRKNTTLHKYLVKLKFNLKDSNIKDHVYVGDNEGHVLIATNYRYKVDKDDNLKEWLDFSIIRPDETVTNTLLYVTVDHFSVSVDSYYFENLIHYQNWTPRQKVLDIAIQYMKP